MADIALVFLLIFVFALARGYVAACVRLIGSARIGSARERAEDAETDPGPPVAAISPLPILVATATANWVSLAIALVLALYLIVALVRPERF